MSLHFFRFVFLRSELCFEVNNYTNTSSEKVKRFFDTAFTRATQKKGTRSNDGGSDDSTWLEEAIAASRTIASSFGTLNFLIRARFIRNGTDVSTGV